MWSALRIDLQHNEHCTLQTAELFKQIQQITSTNTQRQLYLIKVPGNTSIKLVAELYNSIILQLKNDPLVIILGDHLSKNELQNIVISNYQLHTSHIANNSPNDVKLLSDESLILASSQPVEFIDLFFDNLVNLDVTQATVEFNLTAKYKEQVKHSLVAVGGSFDSLHSGHAALLYAFSVKRLPNARSAIGIMPDVYLSTKLNNNQFKAYPFEVRRQTTLTFCKVMFNSLGFNDYHAIEMIALDQYGLGFAECEPIIDCLIVSEETLSKAKKLNEKRCANNLQSIAEIVCVPLIYRNKNNKLSSSDERINTFELIRKLKLVNQSDNAGVVETRLKLKWLFKQ